VVASKPRSADTAIKALDPTGRGLKIPLWMLSPDAKTQVIAEQSTIAVQALLSTYKLLEPALIKGGRVARKLSETGTSPISGGDDEATRARGTARTRHHASDFATRTGTRRAGDSDEHRASRGDSRRKGGLR
jgi:hypothetical protein